MAKDISITLPEEKWRAIVDFFDLRDDDYPVADAIDRIEKALPVDYAEGTIAEVMIQYADAPAASTVYAKFERGAWRTAGGTTFPPGRILKVGPILAPGDVVLKAENLDGASWSKLRELAVAADREQYDHTAKLLHALAVQVRHHQGL